MRELIRPTLFLVARLGLFLAVVTWGTTGKWWHVQINNKPFVRDVLDNLPERSESSFRGSFKFAVVFLGPGDIVVVCIRPWLIVTIFALFYGVLKWVYRKRGSEPAVDE